MSLPFVPDHPTVHVSGHRSGHRSGHLSGHLSGSTRPSRPPRPDVRPRRLAGDRGQTTAEYALVLLGAAAIAALLLAWASRSGAVGQLFDAVLSHVIGSVR